MPMFKVEYVTKDTHERAELHLEAPDHHHAYQYAWQETSCASILSTEEI